MTFAFYELAARREVRMSNPLHQAPSVESEGGSVMAKLHPLELFWARDSFDGFGRVYNASGTPKQAYGADLRPHWPAAPVADLPVLVMEPIWGMTKPVV